MDDNNAFVILAALAVAGLVLGLVGAGTALRLQYERNVYASYIMHEGVNPASLLDSRAN